METKETVKQPEWHAPNPSTGFNAGLNVLNSLTSSKVPFIPAKGKQVSWYICGPTTYDSSHLGHARNYVTFDIIRRILEDYFGYDVNSVMNITDVDDKIILKARRNYLFDKYAKENPIVNEKVVADLKESWMSHIASLEKKLKGTMEDTDKKVSERDAEIRLLREKIDEAKKIEHLVKERLFAIASVNNNSADSVDVIKLSKEPLSILLDSRDGHSVTDPTIFRATAAIYEDEFMEDMRNLNVKMPDVLTRVTEYIPEIIDYVKKIEDNGYAYRTNDGSVYFDTLAFSAKHAYAKLEPWSVGNSKLIQEGEGSLASGSGKKYSNDFALWKSSKKGEPSWQSPWGMGRPGWHIECSAMASSLIGGTLDIHSGGEDLKFPHHDNELAQSEAYYNSKQWVNYFLHSGHLHIEGLKMSKSLKNFITIREALQKASPRQLRLMFLAQPWHKVMNYSADTMESIKSKEKSINEFFLVVRSILQEQEHLAQVNQKWSEVDIALHRSLLKAQDGVDAAMKDNFDTPAALASIMELISDANKYIMENKERQSLLLRRIGMFVTKILRIWGLSFAKDFSSLGEASETVDTEKILQPYLKALATFRSSVRSAAIAKKDPSEILKYCDDIRDDVLPPLGVRLEDSGLIPFKLDDPAVIMKEIAERKAAKVLAQKKSTEQKIKTIQDELEELEKGKLSPKEAFEKEGFKDFDAEGLPTKDKEDKEVNKSARKKLQKQLQTQQKLHSKYQEKVSKDPEYQQKKQKELEEWIAKLSQL